MAATLITADTLLGSTLLRDEDGRATWARMSEEERAVLLAWVNKPRWARGRRTRLKEAINALNAEGATSNYEGAPGGGVAGTIVGGIADFMLPWDN